MADEIRAFSVTTPAGTSAAAPLLTALDMPPREVRRVEVVIPSGCNGSVGFAIGAAGQNIIPLNNGGWIIGSGETVGWDVTTGINSGAWQIQSWNVGRYPHTLNVRFLLDLVRFVVPPTTPAIIPAASLSTMTPADMLSMLAVSDSSSIGA